MDDSVYHVPQDMLLVVSRKHIRYPAHPLRECVVSCMLLVVHTGVAVLLMVLLEICTGIATLHHIAWL